MTQNPLPLLTLLLSLSLSSCSFLLESLEMSNPKLSCVKREKQNQYSVSGIQFQKESNVVSLIPNQSQCFKAYGLSGFRGIFETNNLMSRTRENFNSGNSAFIQVTILDFINLDKKYKTNQESKKMVEFAINKRILEVKSNNPRYSNFISKLGKIQQNNKSICQDLFQSMRDHKAPNLPKSEKYLVMNNFYKSCAISDLEIVIDISVSVRANKQDIKNFNLHQLKDYVTSVEKLLLIKETQESLYSEIHP